MIALANTGKLIMQSENKENIVEVKKEGAVTVVYLNRPDKHNALTIDLFERIVEVGEEILHDDACRAVVLCGNGPSFCAGLDFKAMQGLMESPESAADILARLFKRDDGPDNIAQRVAYIWRKIPVPVIASLHGAVLGGGFQIALGADIRIAAPDAKFSIMEIRYGLIPDMGITQTLPGLMAPDRALELATSGRKIDAEEALNGGLITRVDSDPYTASVALATQIAAQSPSAVRATKKLFHESWRGDAEKTLALEESLQRQLIGGADQVEAVTAAVEKRQAVF